LGGCGAPKTATSLILELQQGVNSIYAASSLLRAWAYTAQNFLKMKPLTVTRRQFIAQKG
jgi:hypothetical protein